MVHSEPGESFIELSPEAKRAKIVEILNPRTNPAACFQSYEYFDSNGDKEGFLNDEFSNPSLDYPNLHQDEKFAVFLDALDNTIEQVKLLEDDPDYLAATIATLEFRKAEISYVQLQADIDSLVRNGGSATLIEEKIEQARLVGYELYGRLDPEIVDMALGEIWHQIDDKELSDSAKVLRQELEDGFSWQGRGITRLPRPSDPNVRLPNLAKEKSLSWAGEQMLDQNGDVVSLLEEYWTQYVLGPANERNEKPRCTPEQIAELFESIINHRDPDGSHGIGVITDDNAISLSWDSPTMSLKVGMKRPVISKLEKLTGLVMHEFGVHGQRGMKGLETDMPVLGLGLFTDTNPPDYTTYEEGLATLIEAAIKGETPHWDPPNLGHYVHISLAEAGDDFRAVYEKAWRYRLLMRIKPDEEVTEEMVAKEKNSAYNSVVRIFRGTPADLAQRRPDVTSKPYVYPKDQAYLAGRVRALKDLRNLYDAGDEEGFNMRLAGKYDPLIPEQAAIVEKVYGRPVHSN